MKRIFSLVISIALVFSMAGCATTGKTTTTTPEQSLTIAYSSYIAVLNAAHTSIISLHQQNILIGNDYDTTVKIYNIAIGIAAQLSQTLIAEFEAEKNVIKAQAAVAAAPTGTDTSALQAQLVAQQQLLQQQQAAYQTLVVRITDLLVSLASDLSKYGVKLQVNL